jgi:ABC-type uncharacterized transport system permease subunit
MKEMLKRIFMVAFILLVLTAISGFFYMQKHGKVLNGERSGNERSTGIMIKK